MRDSIQTSEISGKTPSWLQQVWVNKNAIKMLFCLFQWNHFLNKKLLLNEKLLFTAAKLCWDLLFSFMYVSFLAEQAKQKYISSHPSPKLFNFISLFVTGKQIHEMTWSRGESRKAMQWSDQRVDPSGKLDAYKKQETNDPRGRELIQLSHFFNCPSK